MSPDAKFVAYTNEDELRVWKFGPAAADRRVPTKKFLGCIELHVRDRGGLVDFLAFERIRHEGDHSVAYSGASVFDGNTGEAVEALVDHAGHTAICMSTSADGLTRVFGVVSKVTDAQKSPPGSARVFDMASGRLLVDLPAPSKNVYFRAVTLSRHDNVLAATTSDGRVVLWTARDGKYLGWVKGMTAAFSPSGDTLYVSRNDTSIVGWKVARLLAAVPVQSRNSNER